MYIDKNDLSDGEQYSDSYVFHATIITKLFEIFKGILWKPNILS